MFLQRKRRNEERGSKPQDRRCRSKRHCKVHAKAEALGSVEENNPRRAGRTVRVRQSSLCLARTKQMVSPITSLLSLPVRLHSFPTCTCRRSFVFESFYGYGRATDSGDARRWQLIFETPPRPLFDPKPACDQIAVESIIDLRTALALEPPDLKDISTKSNSISHYSMDTSEDVQHLIRESDEAFRADEFALPSPRDPSRGWYLADDDFTTTTGRIDSPHVALKRHFHKLARRTLPVLKPQPKSAQQSRLPEFRDTPPVSPSVSKSTSTSSPRRRMAEVTGGMFGLFSRRVFNRSGHDAADGSHHPRTSSSFEEVANRSFETIDSSLSRLTDESLMPVESFHMVHSAAVLGVADVSYFNQELSISALPVSNRYRRRRTPKSLAIGANIRQGLDPSFLTPPSSPSFRNRRSGSYSPDLTTIPEVPSIVAGTPAATASIFGRQSTGPARQRATNSRRRRPGRFFQLSRDRQGKGITNDDANQRELTSTPYSLTSPGFRHGSIRLTPRSSAVAGLEHSQSQSSSSDVSPRYIPPIADNLSQINSLDGQHPSLDRAAFQAALTGMTGDHLIMDAEAMAMSHGAYLIREDLEREIDDIIKWWTDFGLDAGQLTRAASAEMSSSKDQMEDHKRPCVEFGLSTTADRVLQDNDDDDDDEGAASSLPPSPMEDLRLAELRREGSGYVPMGRNLRHDLGDYLRWRSALVAELIKIGESEELAGPMGWR